MNEFVHDIASMVSLVFTSPLLSFSAWVIFLFAGIAWRGLTSKERMTHVEWMSLGIVVSHAGNILDNIYWGIAWSAAFIGVEAAEIIFDSGVYSNIFFRQLAGWLGSLCHVIGAIEYIQSKREWKRIRQVTIYSLVVGGLYVAALLAFKN